MLYNVIQKAIKLAHNRRKVKISGSIISRRVTQLRVVVDLNLLGKQHHCSYSAEETWLQYSLPLIDRFQNFKKLLKKCFFVTYISRWEQISVFNSSSHIWQVKCI